LLINGAIGGVGHFGVQAAKALGAHVTTTSSPDNVQLARLLGADSVYSYSGDNILGSDAEFDAIFDAWGMMPRKNIRKLLRPGGVYASPILIPWTVVQSSWARILYGRKIRSANMRKRPEDFAELEALIEEKKLKPVIDSIFPIQKSSEAFDKAEFGKPRGKVVISLSAG